MPPLLLQPHASLSHAEALQVAQQAPEFLRKNPASYSASPLLSLFSPPENSKIWTIYENLLLACLRTGDNTTAHQCLERLVVRFGASDERIAALEGLVKEAEATNNGELEKVLKEYEAILAEDNTNTVSPQQIHIMNQGYANMNSQSQKEGLRSYVRWGNRRINRSFGTVSRFRIHRRRGLDRAGRFVSVSRTLQSSYLCARRGTCYSAECVECKLGQWGHL